MRKKIEGQQTVGGWKFGDDVVFSQEERIADILADAKKEAGQFWQLSDEMQIAVKEEVEQIEVIYHKHNGRVQRFSVYVPKKLLQALKIADDQEKLFQADTYNHYA